MITKFGVMALVLLSISFAPLAGTAYAVVDGAAGTPVSDSSNNCSGGMDSSSCGIVKYVVIFTNILAALVGVVVVLSIVIGGIQYMSSGSNPQQVAKAKSRIINALLALVIFLFMYGFLQWLIPGGLF